jgi:hypothetical protein
VPNSEISLYGSFLKYGDGIHLGYNYYADANGLPQIIAAGGATSRISVGHGTIVLATGSVGVQPNFENVQISGTVTTVNGTFNNFCDQNAKQDFEPVNSSEILEKLAQLPVSEWSYKTDAATRHIGPVAQDFYAAFDIGTDDKHIAPIDEGGVALAAIKALYQKQEEDRPALKAKEEEIEKLNAQNEALSKRLSDLERLVAGLANKTP